MDKCLTQAGEEDVGITFLKTKKNPKTPEKTASPTFVVKTLFDENFCFNDRKKNSICPQNNGFCVNSLKLVQSRNLEYFGS